MVASGRPDESKFKSLKRDTGSGSEGDKESPFATIWNSSPSASHFIIACDGGSAIREKEGVNLATILEDCGSHPRIPRERGEDFGEGENGVSPSPSGSLDCSVMTNSTKKTHSRVFDLVNMGQFEGVLMSVKKPGKRKKERIFLVCRDGNEMMIQESDLKDSDLLITDLTNEMDGEGTRIWRIANDEVRKPRGEMDMEKIRDCAYRYAYLMNEKRLVFLGEDDNGNKYLRFERMAHMLDMRYWDGLRKRLSRIRMKGMGLTLTMRCDENTSVYEDRKRISSCWNKMRLFLQRKFRGLVFFMMSEYGENMRMVHLHIFIKGLEPPRTVKEFQDLHRDISDAWHRITGDSYNVWISRMKRRADRYFMKYILKATSKGFTDSLILAWACGLRVWTCSRGFWDSYTSQSLDYFEMITDPLPVAWELLGIIEVQNEAMRESETTIWFLPAGVMKNDYG
jgi:hypothetical protein